MIVSDQSEILIIITIMIIILLKDLIQINNQK